MLTGERVSQMTATVPSRLKHVCGRTCSTATLEFSQGGDNEAESRMYKSPFSALILIEPAWFNGEMAERSKAPA